MECPNCKYDNSVDYNNGIPIKTSDQEKYGDMHRIYVQTEDGYCGCEGNDSLTKVYGCPKCKIVFID